MFEKFVFCEAVRSNFLNRHDYVHDTELENSAIILSFPFSSYPPPFNIFIGLEN